MKILRLALALVLCLLCSQITLAGEADTPATPSLEQLAAQLFVPEPTPPAEELALDLGLDWEMKSHCTGSACAVWICTCQEDCAPCGIKKVACATGVCICNPPC